MLYKVVDPYGALELTIELFLALKLLLLDPD